MIVYFDTEFTDLIGIVVDIKLISAGFVAQDGQELYFELTDNFHKSDCSSFVVEAVLPHLDMNKHGLMSAKAADRLKFWIETFDEPVSLATDAPGYDWALIYELLAQYNCWPENLSRSPVKIDGSSVSVGIEKYFEYQPMAIRHHALWDARALEEAMKLHD